MSQGEMGNMAFQQPVEAPGFFTFMWKKFVAEFCDGEEGDALSMSCVHFINFCEEYLSKDRPSLTFVAHNNVGVQLAGGARVVIAPPMTDAPGGAMAATALPNQGAVMITGNAKAPSGAEDMSQFDERTFASKKGKATSATVEQKPENLAQDDQFTRRRT